MTRFEAECQPQRFGSFNSIRLTEKDIVMAHRDSYRLTVSAGGKDNAPVARLFALGSIAFALRCGRFGVVVLSYV